jgi:hypothetical protein
MRKLLVAVLCIGVVSAPVAVAFAAEGDDEDQKTASALRDEAKAKLRNAKARAKHERAMERKRERKEKRERLASSGGGKTAASAPAQGGQGSSGGASNPTLEKIAACESGGDPSAVGGGGQFRGKYQFDQGTWASVGGSGDPAAASEAEQDKRAAMLLARSGSNPWPNCG